MTFPFSPPRLLWAVFLLLAWPLGLSVPALAAAKPQAVQSAVASPAFRTFFVGSVVQQLLGRSPSNAEAAPLMAQLSEGGPAWQKVIITVAASPAYFQKAGRNNPAFVGQLFGDLVGRAPDAVEETPAATEFLKTGSRDQLAQVLADTEEFRAHWTQTFYQVLMERAATESEAAAGAAKLETGGITALATLILASPEFFQKAGNTQNGWQTAVNRTFQNAGAGMNESTSMPLPSNPAMPMNNSRAPMVQALLSSSEYHSGLVRAYYQKFLRRAATPAELEQWSGALQGGGSSDQILLTVLTSDEYFNRAGGTTVGYLNRLSQDLLGKAGKATSIPSKNELLNMLRNLPGKLKNSEPK